MRLEQYYNKRTKEEFLIAVSDEMIRWPFEKLCDYFMRKGLDYAALTYRCNIRLFDGDLNLKPGQWSKVNG